VTATWTPGDDDRHPSWDQCGAHLEEIKDHLGHASIRTTSDRYGHLYDTYMNGAEATLKFGLTRSEHSPRRSQRHPRSAGAFCLRRRKSAVRITADKARCRGWGCAAHERSDAGVVVSVRETSFRALLVRWRDQVMHSPRRHPAEHRQGRPLAPTLGLAATPKRPHANCLTRARKQRVEQEPAEHRDHYASHSSREYDARPSTPTSDCLLAYHRASAERSSV
jgi:hypothetical protein